MDPSEEVRLLRDRIAQLERQQTTNSQLLKCRKALRAELAHQKLVNDHKALQTKVEQYQRQQQQTIDEFTEKQKGLLPDPGMANPGLPDLFLVGGEDRLFGGAMSYF
uniref:GOLGA2L5 domain-containing protein n=1 Tax=Globodera pallida TaxID=36090 RepID=A0A183BLQ7_GLOPA